jgi:hypothetical protein
VRVVKGDTIQVRVSRRERLRWTAVAADAEVTLSEMVRAAVREHLRRLPPARQSEEDR